MQTLLNRVRLLSKSSTSITTNDQVLESLRGGSRFVISMIPNRYLIHMAQSSPAVTAGGGIDINEASEVVAVYRNGYHCEEVPQELAYAFITSTTVSSIFDGTAMFPRFYKRDSRVYIKPNPTTAASGIVSYILLPDINEATLSGNWKFSSVEDIVVNYASYLESMTVAAFYREQIETRTTSNIANISSQLSSFESALPTWQSVVLPSVPASPTISISYTAPSGYTLPDSITLTLSLPIFIPSVIGVSMTEVNDALTKAADLIDAVTMGGDTEPQSAQYWLSDEDPEMAIANINTAAQEVSRAHTAIEKQTLYVNEFSVNLQAEVNRFSSSVDKYRAELEKEVARVNAVLSSYSAEQHDSDSTLTALIEDTRLEVQQWASEANEIISRYQAEVQGEAQRFSMQLQKAMAYLQEAQVIIASAQNITLYAETFKASISAADRFYRTALDMVTRYQYKMSGMIPGAGSNNGEQG